MTYLFGRRRRIPAFFAAAAAAAATRSCAYSFTPNHHTVRYRIHGRIVSLSFVTYVQASTMLNLLLLSDLNFKRFALTP